MYVFFLLSGIIVAPIPGDKKSTVISMEPIHDDKFK